MGLGEIDKNFYCSSNFQSNEFMRKCIIRNQKIPCPYHCYAYHRKYPTPEQFKEEYGVAYSDEGAVYWTHIVAAGREPTWNISTYKEAKNETKNASGYSNVSVIIVCACTPFGKPDNSWRPKC